MSDEEREERASERREGRTVADERMRILDMLSEGKITAEQAAELLSALEPAAEPEPEPAQPGPRRPVGPPFGRDFPFGPGGVFGPRGKIAGPAGAFAYALHGPRDMSRRSLVFDIRDGDTRAFARLPLGLVQSADRFLPREVRQYLKEYEVNLEQLLELLANVDLPGHELHGGADLLDIRRDDRRFRIYVQ